MHNVRVGQQRVVRALNKHFPLALDASHCLMIAGGIDITAILGRARSLAASQRSSTLQHADGVGTRTGMGSKRSTMPNAESAAQIQRIGAVAVLVETLDMNDHLVHK